MRILVVEDDAPLADVLRRGLTEDGYATDVVGKLSDALHAVDSNDYDLVVLDRGLPDGDGRTLCAHMRSNGDGTPVLMLTARDGLGDKVEGLDAGADDYLTKPFDYPELTARIRALLRRPTESQAPILTHGQLEMDPASRRVSRSSITIPLTAREFALLEVLLRAPLTTHPRTDLLERVWDANYDGLSNVVDVHIANLRRKLELPGLPDPIETVRGVGYRLTPIGNE
ncbi:MAG: response regulator transcription factor [Acidimicrobiia bacterium]|nr:response regulator transcription factor [Acidimicrobiia bacterium]